MSEKINEEYLKIECISRMEEQYLSNLKDIVNYYGPKLSTRIVADGSAYTLHNFNHHCINLYKIISDIIFTEVVFVDDKGLTQKELYILNLAVLFHDIGMSEVVDMSRDNHSVCSAEYIQREFDDSRSTFKSNSNLNSNELKALKAIIIAHSNVKDKSIKPELVGLKSPDLKNRKPGIGKPIRTKFLAGILRLADELDVTVERIGTGELSQELKEIKDNLFKKKNKVDSLQGDEKEALQIRIKKDEKLLESLEHWERLRLFSEVERKPDSDIVTLNIDDDYITLRCDEGCTSESLAREIVYVYQKILGELESIRSEVLDSINTKLLFAVEKVTYHTEIDELNKEIERQLHISKLSPAGEVGDLLSTDNSVIVPDKDLNNIKNKGGSDKETEKYKPEVIDVRFEEILTNFVRKRDILKVGHFLLNEKFCSRDWIDTKEVIETGKIMGDIVYNLVKHINYKLSDNYNYLIVGIDLEGTLVASRVALALQRPFTYIIPIKEEQNNSNKDMEMNIENYDKIILITDAIVTFDTVHSAIKRYGILNKIISIYTIFYRNSSFETTSADNYELLAKTYSINNKFNIEMFEKEKCVYIKDGCLASNRKMI